MKTYKEAVSELSKKGEWIYVSYIKDEFKTLSTEFKTQKEYFAAKKTNPISDVLWIGASGITEKRGWAITEFKDEGKSNYIIAKKDGVTVNYFFDSMRSEDSGSLYVLST